MTYKPEEIELIKSLRESNVSWKAIGLALKKSPNALRNFWSRYKAIEGLPPRPILDKSITAGRVGTKIKKAIREDGFRSVRDVTAILKEELGPENRAPSKSTVHLYMKRQGLVNHKLLKKPLLSARNIERRLAFAREHLTDIDLLISDTIWSDETCVRKIPKDKDLYYWSSSTTRRQDLPTNFQIQQGGFSVMFWGCFSAFGLGPLVALEGNQNQHTYLDTLRDYLVPEIEAARELGVDMVFMQDNAPCHKTNLVMAFLAQNQIQTLDWPPQSPDLNPIENLWAIVKARRFKKFGIPRSKIELIEQIFEIWEAIDQELLDTLVDSIENRLREVVRLRGRTTKY
jgi:transposase